MALAVFIRPTIPDNEGRTAFSTLRRLGVQLGGLERAELLLFSDDCAVDAVLAAVHADESVFNSNTHAVSVAVVEKPAAGEVWIASDIPDVVAIDGIGEARRLTAWTLRGTAGPADEATIALALERLLCNRAVQHVVACA
jgi:hypothetical protein